MLGFLILFVFTCLVFFPTLKTSLDHDSEFILPVLLLIVVALLYQYKNEFTDFFRLRQWDYELSKEDFYNFLSVVGGALTAYLLSINLELGPVVAAGLVGVLIALLKPKYGVPVYCGAFVGMVSCDYLHTVPALLLAGVIGGVIFVVTGPVMNGFGGKLGTIAFAGCIFAGNILGSPLQSDSIPAWDTGWLIVFYSVLAAVITYFLSVRLKHGPVMASGFVGLAGGLILPALHAGVGETLGVMVICSSFAGMSSEERFPRTSHMIFAGFFTGLIFLFSLPYLGGPGGKLGTIAFGSVIAQRGIMEGVDILKTKIAPGRYGF